MPESDHVQTTNKLSLLAFNFLPDRKLLVMRNVCVVMLSFGFLLDLVLEI